MPGSVDTKVAGYEIMGCKDRWIWRSLDTRGARIGEWRNTRCKDVRNTGYEDDDANRLI